MKKVLHILNELKPSGAEVMMASSYMYWKEYGFHCEILSTGEDSGEYKDILEDIGYTIHHIPFKLSINFLWKFYLLLKNEKFDIVHIHTERANFLYGLVCLIYKVPKVIRTIHSTFTFKGLPAKKRIIQRFIMRKLGINQISISPSVQNVEKTILKNTTEVIFNWYNTDKFHPIKLEEKYNYRNELGVDINTFVLVSVGNCSEIKNHKEILYAIKNVPENKKILYLHLGQEDENCTERSLVEKLGIENRVEFLGYKSDVRPFLWAADAFIMPSLYEGLGNAALEALGCSVDCILADTQGLKDLKRFSNSIFWVEINSTSISKAILKVMDIPREIRFVRALNNSNNIINSFGIERGVKEYIRSYNS